MAVRRIGPVKLHAYVWANLRRYRRCPASAVPGRTSVQVCTAVDWHSLLQWACSPVHWSGRVKGATLVAKILAAQEHEGVSHTAAEPVNGIRLRHSSIRITFENGWHTKRHHHPARNPRYPACFRDSPNPRRTRAKQQISLTKPPEAHYTTGTSRPGYEPDHSGLGGVMRLKRLEMQGYKSFAAPTELVLIPALRRRGTKRQWQEQHCGCHPLGARRAELRTLRGKRTERHDLLRQQRARGAGHGPAMITLVNEDPQPTDRLR